MNIDSNMNPDIIQNVLYLGSIVASFFAWASIKERYVGLRKKHDLTDDERTFLGGLERNEMVVSFAEAVSHELGPSYAQREELQKRSRLLVECTVGSFRTLSKSQEYISSAVTERF